MSADWPPPPPPAEPPAPPAPPVIPWEQPGVPWTKSLFETVKLVLTRPRVAFERMPVAGDALRPLVFAILLGWVGWTLFAIWSMAFRGTIPTRGWFGRDFLPAYLVPLTVLFAPIVVVTMTLLKTAILHVTLIVVGGARNGFGTTLRVLCYAQAAQVFWLLPFAGKLVYVLAEIALVILGLAVAHRITLGKSALAVLLPTVLCCGCILAAAFTLFATYISRIGWF